jgi:hypothetical protein
LDRKESRVEKAHPRALQGDPRGRAPRLEKRRELYRDEDEEDEPDRRSREPLDLECARGLRGRGGEPRARAAIAQNA